MSPEMSHVLDGIMSPATCMSHSCVVDTVTTICHSGKWTLTHRVSASGFQGGGVAQNPQTHRRISGRGSAPVWVGTPGQRSESPPTPTTGELAGGHGQTFGVSPTVFLLTLRVHACQPEKHESARYHVTTCFSGGLGAGPYVRLSGYNMASETGL